MMAPSGSLAASLTWCGRHAWFSSCSPTCIVLTRDFYADLQKYVRPNQEGDQATTLIVLTMPWSTASAIAMPAIEGFAFTIDAQSPGITGPGVVAVAPSAAAESVVDVPCPATEDCTAASAAAWLACCTWVSKPVASYVCKPLAARPLNVATTLASADNIDSTTDVFSEDGPGCAPAALPTADKLESNVEDPRGLIVITICR